ncbi:MAG TPA: hypothetical protein VFI95_07285 [Terriglobales bacterium]|nr:hypothetical protein [Terriglobales bacterium]
MAIIQGTNRWSAMKPQLRAAGGNTNLRANAVTNGWSWLVQERNPSPTTWMDGSAAIPEAADGSGKGTALVEMKIWRQE